MDVILLFVDFVKLIPKKQHNNNNQLQMNNNNDGSYKKNNNNNDTTTTSNNNNYKLTITNHSAEHMQTTTSIRLAMAA